MAVLTTLFSFNFNVANGNDPRGALVMDSSGDLFGTTSGNGDGVGTVFELSATATGYASAPTTFAYFNNPAVGSPPNPGLVIDAAGDLIGTTRSGGANGLGTVYEFVNTGTGYATSPTVLFNFTSSSGGNPVGDLITDAAGDLFGTTTSGGANGAGTVFEIAKTATGYASAPTVLASLSGSGGATFYGGGLTMDAAGNLFGTTNLGGANNEGSVFEIAKTANGYSSTPTTLVSFNGANGSYPAGTSGLIMDAAGDLFGTTSGDFTHNDGTVFEIVKTADGYSNTPITLVTFNGTNGAFPYANLVMDAAGNLYGTTTSGGAGGDGTVFRITLTAAGYASVPTTLVNFNGTNGESPFGSLLIDAAGDLIGTTELGGANNGNPQFATGGTIFELSSVAATTVSVSGTAQEGQTLTANTNQVVADYQWQSLVDGQWTNISSATSATYVVQQADDGRQLRVQVVDTAGFTVFSAASNAVLDAAGNQPVYESAYQSTIGSGLFQYVYGTATSTTVNGGGEQNIYATGTATGTTLNAGATQVDWGTATGTTIDGGSQYVWGSASNTTLTAGMQDVEVGGVANDTTIGIGGEQVVIQGGSVSSTSIEGGTQAVYGTADQTTVDTGGLQYVHGNATNTVVNSGGEQNVYAGGTASGTTLNAGATQVDWGNATGTTIDGGSQYVWGSASNTTIVSGVQDVGAGGIATDTTIGQGANEYVSANGAADGVTFAGPYASLQLDQSSAFSGTISGWQAGDYIRLGDIAFSDAGTTLAYVANSDNSGGTLTVSDGTHTATLALLGQYAAAEFALSSDGQGGTFVSDPAIISQQNVLAPAHG